MSKHTPGPWVLGDENNQHAQVCLGDSMCSVDLRRFADYPTCEGMSREEMLANARLIAAAPEMLEVLLLVRLWGDSENHTPESYAFYDKARSILQKVQK